MQFRVLINDAVKSYLLLARAESRHRLRKAIEYLENGLWDGGLRIKKLHGASNKVVLEGRLSRDDRILFTLGREERQDNCGLVYLWAVSSHDDVTRKARVINPETAPFLSFTEYEARDLDGAELESLGDSCMTQESIEQRIHTETSAQRWFVLNEAEWARILLYSKDDLEIFLYLTTEQEKVLARKPPMLLSGTAGSGKTTLSVYYLLRPHLHRSRKLFVTYNRRLRNFCERLYAGLLNLRPDHDRIVPPDFLTFKELCLRLLGSHGAHFRPEREVDTLVFPEIFRKHRFADKYDPMLVWEEIRSIIKGAKPQITAFGLRNILKKQDGILQDPELTRQLQEELLAVGGLSVAEKAGSAFQRVLGCTLTQTAMKLEDILKDRPAPFFRALHTVADQIEKHEADFVAPLMTLAEYELLGRKRAPLFVYDRREIYSIAEWYQNRLKAEELWDEIDLTRAVIRALDARTVTKPAYEFVCCDEVQDLTDIQLSLLVRLPTHPSSLLMAGDPKQIINPSGFRWEDARKLFYDRGMAVPEILHLTLNFRCSGSIVLLSNALLELKRELLGIRHDEKMDEWKYQGRPPFLIEQAPETDLLKALRLTGADRIVLTRSVSERDRLKDLLGTELVFTIQEAKGLEFKSVLLWKFAVGQTDDLWLRMMNQDTAKIHDAVIRHEINLLYVGITRAQQNLILYDGPKPSVIWSSRLAEHVFRTQSAELLDEAWRTVSTPKEWKQQGDYFAENEHYRAAAECYRNAGLPNLMHRASAQACAKRADHSQAAAHWEAVGEYRAAAEAYELAGLPAEALLLWEHLQDEGRAAGCRIRILEMDKRYGEAAELWEERQRWDRAKENWHKAGRHDRLAPIYERERRYLEAAGSYEACREYGKAAELYIKAKQTGNAAVCFERAGLYEEAIQIWRRLHKMDAELACLKRMNDPRRLAIFYEEHRDWKMALDHYRKVTLPDFTKTLEVELATKYSRPSHHGPRAVRFTLLAMPGLAGKEWERLKIMDLAVEQHVAAQDHEAAGRCLARQRKWLNAVHQFARSDHDASAGHRNLRMCVKKCILEHKHSTQAMLEALATALRNEKRWAGAATILRMIGHPAEAAECLAEQGRLDAAVDLWAKSRAFDVMTRWLITKREFERGLQAFEILIEKHTYPWRGLDAQEYENLLRAWHAAEPSTEQHGTILNSARRHPFLLSVPFLIEILEPAGFFDEILMAGTSAMQRMRDNEYQKVGGSLFSQARAKEKEGDMAAAGLRYLLVDQPDEASRCWSQVKASENAIECLAAAGLNQKILEHWMREKNPWMAGWTAVKLGQMDLAIELLQSTGKGELAAEYLEHDRQYEAALVLYRAARNIPKVARMLERLKRYEEAAKAYKSIGNKKKYEDCKNKAAG